MPIKSTSSSLGCCSASPVVDDDEEYAPRLPQGRRQEYHMDQFEQPIDVVQKHNIHTYSLKELYKLLKNDDKLSTSELVEIWTRLPQAKKEADEDQKGLFSGLVNLVNGKTPQEFHDLIRPYLIETIANRFLSGRRGLGEAAKKLDPAMVQHIIRYIVIGVQKDLSDFCGPKNKAAYYDGVRNAGLRDYPNFDLEFFTCLGKYTFSDDEVRQFFKDARARYMDFAHLLHLLEKIEKNPNISPVRREIILTEMVKWPPLPKFTEHPSPPPQAKPARRRVDPNPLPQAVSENPIKEDIDEYNELLRSLGVEKQYGYSEYADPEKLRHGFRLATLKTHPDKGGTKAQFEQLVRLAEALEIK